MRGLWHRLYDRPVRRRGLALDLLVCVLLVGAFLPVTFQADAPDGAGAGTGWDSILLPLVALPILLRRRAPVLAAAAFALGCVVSALPTLAQFRLGVAIPAAMLIAYSLGSGRERRPALLGLALLLGGLAVVGAIEAVLEDEGGVVA